MSGPEHSTLERLLCQKLITLEGARFAVRSQHWRGLLSWAHTTGSVEYDGVGLLQGKTILEEIMNLCGFVSVLTSGSRTSLPFPRL